MKNVIEGFNQRALLWFGLDAIDSVILRYIVDFFQSPRIKKVVVENKEYMWLSYQKILDDLPILDIQKKSIVRKFEKYAKCGLMEKYVDKEQGNFTYFRFTELYEKLVCDFDELDFELKNKKENISEKREGTKVTSPMDKNVQTYGQNCPDLWTKMSIPMDKNVQTKIVLLNSTNSIENINNNIVENSKKSEEKKMNIEEKAIEVLEYLNQIAGKRYKPIPGNLKFIRARLEEKFSVEDLKKVVDFKYSEWKNDPVMKEYIRPQTLFNSEKCDGYLNNAILKEKTVNMFLGEDKNKKNEEKYVAPEFDMKLNPEEIQDPKLRAKYEELSRG